jgi:O-acetyl-ADP-ribose deacetylase (regulator of RNase III)
MEKLCSNISCGGLVLYSSKRMSDLLKFELPGGHAILLEVGDITRRTVDAIVNAANSSLMGGGGVDGAIHRAGGPAILEECKKVVARQGHLPPGQVVSTTGGHLKAAFVIHTVGPIWRGGMEGEAGLLASCYRESIRLADRLHLETMAFPAISTGVYGYPVADAAQVAFRATFEELKDTRTIREVRLVLFSEDAYKVFATEGRKYVESRPGLAQIHTIQMSSSDERDT